MRVCSGYRLTQVIGSPDPDDLDPWVLQQTAQNFGAGKTGAAEQVRFDHALA